MLFGLIVNLLILAIGVLILRWVLALLGVPAQIVTAIVVLVVLLCIFGWFGEVLPPFYPYRR